MIKESRCCNPHFFDPDLFVPWGLTVLQRPVGETRCVVEHGCWITRCGRTKRIMKGDMYA